MPLVTPSAFLPLVENSGPSPVAEKNTKRAPLRTVVSRGPSSSVGRGRPVLAEKRAVSPSAKEVMDVAEEKPRFPTAVIDVESISDVMAARLTMCLLGHVLFLKSQVPFPVAQLMKMSSRRKTDQRPNKKLDKLLVSFDLLSSHLGSTFTALANALSYKSEASRDTRRFEKVHLAIVLGPSATATNFARARVVLEFDGFRVAAIRTSASRSGAVLNGDLKENEGIIRTGGLSMDKERRGGVRERVLSDAANEGSDAEEDARDPSVIEPPPDSDTDSELESGSDDSMSSRAFSFVPVQEETEVDLSAAERLLSRTLAVANSDPDLGMAADIRPTHIHILLRAPRRFSHPEWIPQQESLRKLDSLLDEFNESPVSVGDPHKEALHDITNVLPQSGKENPMLTRKEAKRKGPRGVKTDCVRVRSRGAADQQQNLSEEEEKTDKKDRDSLVGDVTCSEDANEERDESVDDEERDDELIWWSWGDRLEGFTDL